jgi:hypothetical protein
MKRINALIIVGSVSALGVIGCADPGVEYVSPVTGGTTGASCIPGSTDSTAVTGTADSTAEPQTCSCICGAVPTGTADKTTATPTCTCTCGTTVTTTVSPATASAGNVGTEGTGGKTSSAGTVGTAGTGGKTSSTNGATAGRGGSTVSSEVGAGGSTGAGGRRSTGPVPCADGFTCTDLGSVGATVRDKNGKTYQYSCGNNSLMDCTDDNVAIACAALVAPFCATIEIAGQEFRSCAQVCTP